MFVLRTIMQQGINSIPWIFSHGINVMTLLWKQIMHHSSILPLASRSLESIHLFLFKEYGFKLLLLWTSFFAHFSPRISPFSTRYFFIVELDFLLRGLSLCLCRFVFYHVSLQKHDLKLENIVHTKGIFDHALLQTCSCILVYRNSNIKPPDSCSNFFFW